MTKMKTAGFSVVDWLECIWISNLPPNAKYLACYLRTFMNSKQDIAWPSYARIISETGLSRATVAKYLEVLEESQWLIRDRESRSTTTYIATLPQPVFDSFKGMREAIKKGSSPAKLVHELNQGSLGAKPKVVRQLNTNIQGNKQENTQVGETQAEPSQYDISASATHADQPKAPADTAEPVGQTEHEAAPADKPVKKRKTKAETLLDLIRSKPELLPSLNCVDDTLLLEWCQQRERMKAARTDRALSKIDRALDELRTKHRVAPDTAIEAACDKGWRGLEVEWVLNHLSSTGRNMSYQSGGKDVNNTPQINQPTMFDTELTEERKAKNEEMRGRLADLMEGLKK